MRGQPTQAINDRVRLERAVLVGQRDESGGIQLELELGAQHRVKRRVQDRLAAKLELEIATGTADCQRAKQQGRTVFEVAVSPLDHTDAQVDAVDAAAGRQFKPLGRDRSGGDLRRTEGNLIPDQVRQQCRLAGDELRKAAGMRRRQFDPCAGRVDEVQKRRRTADGCQLGPPFCPTRFGHVPRLK